MSTPSAASALHLAILQYLSQVQQAGADAAAELGFKDLEPLAIAIECLTEATGVTLDAEAKPTAGLVEIFRLGSSSVQAIESSPKWPQFLSNLEEKTDFFKGVPAGSLEHAKRMDQARGKFTAKFGGAAPTEETAGASSAPPAVVSAEDKAKAEVAKNEGNALLGKQDHAGAVSKYSVAISLNPQHAIYRANRAAAYVNLREYQKAIDDCKASIAIDPLYPKSHYRMGQSYAALGDHEAALEAFEAALSRSGSDAGMSVTIREQIKLMQNKLNPPVQQHAGGADPFAALGGMGGPGGFDLSSLMNNPMMAGLMNNPGMADMMNSPMMQQMMQNMDFGAMMKDPAMAGLSGPGGLDGAARAAAPKIEEVDTSYTPPSASDLFDDAPAASSAKPAAAAAPKPAAAKASPASQLDSFLNTPAGQAAASDPDLQPVLADIKANGIGAAMKYMSNPAVMGKIQALMGSMRK